MSEKKKTNTSKLSKEMLDALDDHVKGRIKNLNTYKSSTKHLSSSEKQQIDDDIAELSKYTKEISRSKYNKKNPIKGMINDIRNPPDKIKFEQQLISETQKFRNAISSRKMSVVTEQSEPKSSKKSSSIKANSDSGAGLKLKKKS